jgi:hypothetical protein
MPTGQQSQHPGWISGCSGHWAVGTWRITLWIDVLWPIPFAAGRARNGLTVSTEFAYRAGIVTLPALACTAATMAMASIAIDVEGMLDLQAQSSISAT